MLPVSYSAAMEQAGAYLSLELDVSEPVEISDFAALFSGFGGQFDDYVKSNEPELSGKARLYVREVRQGSYVADLIPQIPDLIGLMDGALIVLGFGALFSKRLRAWVAGSPVPEMTKSALRDANDTIRALANAPKGRAVLKSYVYEAGLWSERVEASFTTEEARRATETIEAQARELDATEGADHPRVLMVFTRPDSGDAKVGKRTGERVVIEELSPKPLPLIYGSDLAEQAIKHEITQREYIFKTGFVVDVNVTRRNGKPVAYSVTDLHQVIDLPDDED